MKKTIYMAAILLAGILWGSMPLFSNGMADLGFSPVQTSAARLGVAALILFFVLAIFSPKSLCIKWRDLPLLLVIGVFSVFTMSALYMVSIQMTTGAVAAVLLYTSPIFILIASVILFKEKLTPLKLLSLVLVVVGCVLVSGIVGSGANMNALGVAAGLISGIAYASYSILGTYVLRRYSSMTVTAYAFLFAAIASLAIADLPDMCVTVAAAPKPVYAALLMLGLGTVTAVLPFTLYTYGLSRIEAGRAGILACIEPMTATLLSVLILREPCTGLQWAGIALILAAVVLLQCKKKENEDDRA